MPFSPGSGTSSRAADVFRGSIEEMPVVLKTSACVNDEVNNASFDVVHGSAYAKPGASTGLHMPLCTNHA